MLRNEGWKCRAVDMGAICQAGLTLTRSKQASAERKVQRKSVWNFRG